MLKTAVSCSRRVGKAVSERSFSTGTVESGSGSVTGQPPGPIMRFEEPPITDLRQLGLSSIFALVVLTAAHLNAAPERGCVEDQPQNRGLRETLGEV